MLNIDPNIPFCLIGRRGRAPHRLQKFCRIVNTLPDIVKSQVKYAGVQPQLIQDIRSRDSVGEDQDTIASIRY